MWQVEGKYCTALAAISRYKTLRSNRDGIAGPRRKLFTHNTVASVHNVSRPGNSRKRKADDAGMLPCACILYQKCFVSLASYAAAVLSDSACDERLMLSTDLNCSK